jgi:hypothetical protein
MASESRLSSLPSEDASDAEEEAAVEADAHAADAHEIGAARVGVVVVLVRRPVRGGRGEEAGDRVRVVVAAARVVRVARLGASGRAVRLRHLPVLPLRAAAREPAHGDVMRRALGAVYSATAAEARVGRAAAASAATGGRATAPAPTRAAPAGALAPAHGAQEEARRELCRRYGAATRCRGEKSISGGQVLVRTTSLQAAAAAADPRDSSEHAVGTGPSASWPVSRARLFAFRI